MTDLPPTGRRWPIGHPGEPGFRFCEARTVIPGKPYCAEHCAKAYRSKDENPDPVPGAKVSGAVA